jgi:hypothetical protein
MALVKFYKGLYANYSEDTMTDGVYFATDKHVIRLNGADYGGLNADVFKGIVGNLDLADSKLTYEIYTTGGTWDKKEIILKSTDIQREETESGDTKVAVTGTTVEQAIESLATSIKTVDDNVATYSVKKITGDTLDANVKEAYQLVKTKNGESTPVDVQIPIYKDSALKSITLESEDTSGKKGQFLKYVYTTEDGTETTVYLDCSQLVVEAEFKNGLQVVDGEVSVKVDTTSEGAESFITVSESGVKISGVRDAIDNTVDAAKKELIGDAADDYNTMGKLEDKIQDVDKKASAAHTKVNAKADGHVTVAVETKTTDDGVSYSEVTVSENDIASDADLQAEITRAKAAEDKIEASVGLSEDGSHVATTGNYTSTATTVVGEIAALDTQVKKNADDILNLTNQILDLDVAEIGGEGKVITSVSETDGKITATTIDLTASNVAFAAITGDTASVDVDATKVQDAIASLAKSIKTLETYLTWNTVE